MEEPNGPMPPFSSVYLIDACGSNLICRKHGNDGSPNDTPFSGGPDTPNPLQYGHASIGAMVFMDCDDPVIFRPIETKLLAMQSPKIVCIPVCMSKLYDDQAIVRTWPNRWVVLANSDPGGCNSAVSALSAVAGDTFGPAACCGPAASVRTLANFPASDGYETRGAIAGLQPTRSVHSANLAQCAAHRISGRLSSGRRSTSGRRSKASP